MPVYTETTVPALSYNQLFEAVLNSIEKEEPQTQKLPSYYHNHYYGNQQQMSTVEKCGVRRLAVFEGLNLY